MNFIFVIISGYERHTARKQEEKNHRIFRRAINIHIFVFRYNTHIFWFLKGNYMKKHWKINLKKINVKWYYTWVLQDFLIWKIIWLNFCKYTKIGVDCGEATIVYKISCRTHICRANVECKPNVGRLNLLAKQSLRRTLSCNFFLLACVRALSYSRSTETLLLAWSPQRAGGRGN